MSWHPSLKQALESAGVAKGVSRTEILETACEYVTKDRAAKRLYLDLDGVMADFDAHFPAVTGLDHRSMADDDMWARINSMPTFFLDLPPCPGALDFFRDVAKLDPIILTACPRSNYPHVAQQKRQWVRNHLSKTATVLPVMGGRHKWLFMHAPGDILVDDFAKNLAPWEKAGGVGILHEDFDRTLSTLGRALGGEIATAIGDA